MARAGVVFACVRGVFAFAPLLFANTGGVSESADAVNVYAAVIIVHARPGNERAGLAFDHAGARNEYAGAAFEI
ncbi:MAG: hypothetical protein NT166_16425, partial [Candidatus Aminicenantes bacterium]|nr:hypothetical protein [Candidatus Aminicenantes bacterium]